MDANTILAKVKFYAAMTQPDATAMSPSGATTGVLAAWLEVAFQLLEAAEVTTAEEFIAQRYASWNMDVPC